MISTLRTGNTLRTCIKLSSTCPGIDVDVIQRNIGVHRRRHALFNNFRQSRQFVKRSDGKSADCVPFSSLKCFNVLWLLKI